MGAATRSGDAWIEECEQAVRVVQPDPGVQYPDWKRFFRLPDVVIAGEAFRHRERSRADVLYGDQRQTVLARPRGIEQHLRLLEVEMSVDQQRVDVVVALS